MRIISGTAKGRKLFHFEDSEIRPTSDKLRETIFNVLGQNMEGFSFLDLFAGTGAVGIEALSRGAQKTVFVDNNFNAIELTKNNLAHCKLDINYQYIKADFRKAIENLYKEKESFNFIFIDPPYASKLYEPSLQTLATFNILKNSGIIICEHFFKTKLPEQHGNFCLIKQTRSGESMLSFYKYDILANEIPKQA